MPEERVLDISANLIEALLREREENRVKSLRRNATRTGVAIAVGIVAAALAYGTVSLGLHSYEVSTLQRAIGSKSVADAKRAAEIEKVFEFEVGQSKEAVQAMTLVLAEVPSTVALSRVVLTKNDSTRELIVTGDAESIEAVDRYSYLLREAGTEALVTSIIPNGLLGPKGVAFQLEIKGDEPWNR